MPSRSNGDAGLDSALLESQEDGVQGKARFREVCRPLFVTSLLAIVAVVALCAKGTQVMDVAGLSTNLDADGSSQCVASDVMSASLCQGQGSQVQCVGLDNNGCKWVTWSEEQCVATSPTGVSLCPYQSNVIGCQGLESAGCEWIGGYQEAEDPTGRISNLEGTCTSTDVSSMSICNSKTTQIDCGYLAGPQSWNCIWVTKTTSEVCTSVDASSISFCNIQTSKVDCLNGHESSHCVWLR